MRAGNQTSVDLRLDPDGNRFKHYRMFTRALLIAVAVLSLSNPLFAGTLDAPADHPAGVSGVEWNASPKDAQKAMAEVAGVKLIKATPDKLRFSGGVFAEEEVDEWELSFSAGKFVEASIRLKPNDPLQQYERLRKLIVAKYRKKGREEREGATHRATYWEYSNTRGSWGIACDMLPSRVLVVYKQKAMTPKRTELPSGI